MPNLCGVNQKLLQSALQQVGSGLGSERKERASPGKSADVSIWAMSVHIHYLYYAPINDSPFALHVFGSSDTEYVQSVTTPRALDKREYLMIIFLISHQNHILWPLIWTISLRRFRWGVTTYGFMPNKQKTMLIITKYSLLSIALSPSDACQTLTLLKRPLDPSSKMSWFLGLFWRINTCLIAELHKTGVDILDHS